MPGPPDFSDYHPIHIPPLFRIAFPELESIARHRDVAIEWRTTSSWYFVSSHSVYFDILCWNSKCHRFRIIIEPDLSGASLEIVNTSDLSPLSFHNRVYQRDDIGEDTLFCYWGDNNNPSHYGAYIGLMSPHFAPAATVSLSAARFTRCNYTHWLCPASGRFVHLDITVNGIGIVVHDFF